MKACDTNLNGIVLMIFSSTNFKLPIQSAIVRIHKTLWSSRYVLLLCIIIFALALTIYNFLVVGMFCTRSFEHCVIKETMSPFVRLLILYLPNLLIFLMFSASWHSRCLCLEERVTFWASLKWDIRKTKYLLCSLLFVLGAFAVVVIPTLIATFIIFAINLAVAIKIVPPMSFLATSWILSVPMVILFLLVFLRLSIYLVPTAIGFPMSILESWLLGRGNSWRIIYLFCFSEISLLILYTIMELVVLNSNLEGIFIFLLFQIFRYIFALCFLTAGITSISICYEQLCSRLVSDPLYISGA